jgi:hypothetical protein
MIRRREPTSATGCWASGLPAGILVPPMTPHARDTPLEVEARWIEGLRAMGPRARLLSACDLTETVRALAAARIRERYGPGLSDRELCLRLAALWLDRDTLARAVGWDPEVEGY